jgi:hypothetical protein
MTGRGSLRRQRSTLKCGAIEAEEEGEEEGEEEEKGEGEE